MMSFNCHFVIECDSCLNDKLVHTNQTFVLRRKVYVDRTFHGLIRYSFERSCVCGANWSGGCPYILNTCESAVCRRKLFNVVHLK